MNRIEQIVDEMTLFDDDLMAMVFNKNIPAAELLLRIILQDERIKVVRVAGQKEIRNAIIGGRSVRLDIEAIDRNGIHFDVEVQRSSSGAHPRRARYNSSMLDTTMLKKGQEFDELRDSYVIFITEKDNFHMGKPLYKIHRYLEGTDRQFNDGSHIIYVNGRYRGESRIGKLMHDFACRSADDMNYKELADGVRYFKEEGGRLVMCDAVKEYAKEYAQEERMRETVASYLELGAGRDKTVLRLQEKYNLSKDEAEKKYNEYVQEKTK